MQVRQQQLELDMGDFPGGPVVKTSPSNAGGEGQIPGRELRSHMPQGQKTKTQNRSNLVTDSIKTLKMVYIKKKKKELDMEQQTGSKQEKEFVKAVYCHPVYLTYMQSTS